MAYNFLLPFFAKNLAKAAIDSFKYSRSIYQSHHIARSIDDKIGFSIGILGDFSGFSILRFLELSLNCRNKALEIVFHHIVMRAFLHELNRFFFPNSSGYNNKRYFYSAFSINR